MRKALVAAGLVVVALSSPAQAKCCPLEFLVVTGPAIEGAITVSAAELEDRLHPSDLDLLYWPAFNAPFKGDQRPTGELGPGYTITYVLQGPEEGTTVEAKETVYLDADPPTAFMPGGQTQELYPGDVRPIPAGWRPFPERAAIALKDSLDKPANRSMSDDVVDPRVRSWSARFGPSIAAALVGAIAAVWLLTRRGRRSGLMGG